MQELIRNPDNSQPVKLVLNSVYRIGLAGLGACSKIQQQGDKLMVTLVKVGEEFESRMKERVTSQLDVAENTVNVVLDDANGAWNQVVKLAQERLAWLLKQVGVPSNDDVKELYTLVEKLNQSVTDLAASLKPAGNLVAEARA